MKLYLAGFEAYPNLLEHIEPTNILTSYFYRRNSESLPKHRNLLIDSGGYTVRTQDTNIGVKGYGRWLQKMDVDNYFNLDYPDGKKTEDNQKKLESMGLDPIPVWHPSHGKEKIEELTSNYNYIGIGGISISRKYREKLVRFLSQYKDAKFHLFGVGDSKIIQRYKDFFHSTDTTSWLSGGKFGSLYFFSQGRIKTRKIKNFNQLPHTKSNKWNLIQWKKYVDYLEEEKWKSEE